MRVGIVTQPLQNNYGGILQNWALQQVLKRLGHEPITLDVGLKYGYGRYTLSVGKYFADRLMGRQRRFPAPPCHGRISSRLTGEFFHEHIIATEPLKHCTPGLVDRYSLDAIVVGSDQVWRPLYNSNIEDMFLRFAVGKDIRRVAYAASFGVDHWELTEKQTATCRQLAQDFDAISVREASGVGLCEKHLGVAAVHVLDPTLLHAADYYNALCEDVPRVSEPFIAVYCLDVTEEKRKSFETIAKSKGLPLRFFSANGDVTLTVGQWLAMFRDASMVITDSFHGTVFSIIYQKEFFTVANIERGASRFASLLSTFGLENRLMDKAGAIASESPIDWKDVALKLEEKRQQSLSFLTASLP